MRITVKARGATVVREGHGTGEGRDTAPAEVHDIVLKAAETDATKRALATFGRPFGLELYRNGKATISSQSPPLAPSAPALPNAGGDPRSGSHPDDATPIPKPSLYYNQRTGPSMLEQMREDQRVPPTRISSITASTAPPLAPAAPDSPQGRIDKSQLTIAEPKRLRDKAHLKFVASQPCVICGRQPSDPHHLRFAQPRAIGMNVSDEFTVPLCRGHHRQLHQTGDEVAWWERLHIDALKIAKSLWEKTRPVIN